MAYTKTPLVAPWRQLMLLPIGLEKPRVTFCDREVEREEQRKERRKNEEDTDRDPRYLSKSANITWKINKGRIIISYLINSPIKLKIPYNSSC